MKGSYKIGNRDRLQCHGDSSTESTGSHRGFRII